MTLRARWSRAASFPRAALAEAHYAQIASQDQTIGSFLTLTKERAQAQAERIDRLAEKGDPLPPLAGVPVGIKDVLMTRGERTTAGSRFLEKFIAPYDATAVEKTGSRRRGLPGQTQLR